MCKEIDPKKYYSSRALSRMQILPWKSPMTLNKRLNEGKYKEIFLPVIEQGEKRKHYKIKGENINRFITALKMGQITI